MLTLLIRGSHSGVFCPPEGHWTMSGDIFGCHSYWGHADWQLVGGGERSGILPSILRCTGQLHNKKFSGQTVNSVKVETLGSSRCWDLGWGARLSLRQGRICSKRGGEERAEAVAFLRPKREWQWERGARFPQGCARGARGARRLQLEGCREWASGGLRLRHKVSRWAFGEVVKQAGERFLQRGVSAGTGRSTEGRV